MKANKVLRGLCLFAITMVVLFNVFNELAYGYARYTSGCDTCHGGFRSTPYNSPKGDTWPDSLHDVHRNSSFMDTGCTVCHVSVGDNPLMNSSGSTAYGTTPGYGCIGCHGREYGGTPSGRGLREHHRISGAHACSGCHPSPETPDPENVNPPNYGGSLTKADDSCNNPPGYLEDWSGDNEGLDNDGDNVYDSADPDCMVATLTPTLTPPSTPTFTNTGIPTRTPTPVGSGTPPSIPTHSQLSIILVMVIFMTVYLGYLKPHK